MAIITAHKFDGDGTTREFQIGDSILSKSHCRVWVDNAQPDSSTWDLLGSTILFDVAPPVGAVENVKIFVSNDGTFPAEYTAPSAIETVEAYINDVLTVSGDINPIIALSAITTQVVALGAMTATLTSLYTDKAKLDSLFADKAKLDSLYADKLTLDGLFNSKTAIDSLYTIQAKLESIFADKTKLDSIYADKTALDSIALNLTELLNVDVLAAQVAADRTAVETLYDNFDDRYLGSKASDPALDNDGNALLTGAVYFNTTVNNTRFYNGVSWEDPELTSTQAAAAALASQVAAASSETNAASSEANALTYWNNIQTAISDAIGVTIQGYNANTVIEDRTITAEDNAIDFGGIKKNYELTATAANITALNITALKEGTILVHSAENITGWGTEFKFKNVPTDLLGDEVFSYFIEDATNIWIGRVQ